MASVMPSASHERTRDLLLVLLAVTTGAVDATAYLRLGHVFASVITGNLVVLGASAVQGAGRTALHVGCALGGYALGVIAAAPRRERAQDDPVWPAGTSFALTLDLALLIVFAVGWELSGGRPGALAQVLLVAVAAGAMGVQSTAVRRLGQLSTTYLTSTLTGLLEGLRRRRWSGGNTRSLGILIAALCGAAGAALLIAHARAWVPALALAPPAIVVLSSRRLIEQDLSGQG